MIAPFLITNNKLYSQHEHRRYKQRTYWKVKLKLLIQAQLQLYHNHEIATLAPVELNGRSQQSPPLNWN